MIGREASGFCFHSGHEIWDLGMVGRECRVRYVVRTL